jgi:hypothetical protein
VNHKRKRAKRNPANRCAICSYFRQQGNNAVYGPGHKASDRRRAAAADATRQAYV